MKTDFDYELKKVQKELEKIGKLGEEVSKSVRQSLEDVLDWAKAGYQRQALREQLKSEINQIISEKQELVTHDWCQEGSGYVRRAKEQLEDAFSSKSGKDIQQNLTSLIELSIESEEGIKKLKKSIQSKHTI